MLKNILRVSTLLFLLNAPAFAVGGADSGLESEPAYRDANRLIKAHDYAAAIPHLQQLDKALPNNAEILNLLGFTHRKIKDYPSAKRFYDASLAQDQYYRPALEYQGMWFIETGNIPAALANLARLRQICASCEETKDLEDALASVKP
jgi:tetratricopeptide (TPR) repeat protein